MCEEYYQRVCQIESAKYDMEKEVEIRDYKVSLISINQALHFRFGLHGLRIAHITNTHFFACVNHCLNEEWH